MLTCLASTRCILLQRLSHIYKSCMRQKTLSAKSVIKPQNILELHKREVLQNIFPPASVTLPKQLLTKQCFYCGFDPTADSLHIGNLLTLMMLLHCQRAGHDIIAVIGSATVRMGDPSDHTKDRKLMSQEELENNAKGIRNCIENIFDNHANELYLHRGVKELPKLKILDNREWYDRINVVDFFSTAGRKFRMGLMLDKKFVRERLESEEGLLLPEFLYQVFQAYDWLHLHDTYNCKFQFGGSDQLGNIHAGQHLIRRFHDSEVYGLAIPLVTTASGVKIGKSSNNAVWLDHKKTSPFELYQYFFRQPDSIVEKYLKFFTLIELQNIAEIMDEHWKHPERRTAQKILARNVCKLVHGDSGLKSAQRCTDVLFHGNLSQLENLSDDEIDATFLGMKMHYCIMEPETTVYDIATRIKAIPEGQTGINLINDGAVSINGIKMKVAEHLLLSDFHILKNDLSLITVGKSKHYIVRWKEPSEEHARTS